VYHAGGKLVDVSPATPEVGIYGLEEFLSLSMDDFSPCISESWSIPDAVADRMLEDPRSKKSLF
jgi:hypothetical protein